jgi:hypothetical protein
MTTQTNLELSWLTARPHLSGLASKMQALLELADKLWTQGRADGGDVDYARFASTARSRATRRSSARSTARSAFGAGPRSTPSRRVPAWSTAAGCRARPARKRVGHEVGKEYMQRRRTLEPRLIEALEVPAEARSISVSVDRVAVPMEEPREAHQLPRPPLPAKLQRMVRKNSLGLKLDERTKKVMAEAERVADEHPRKVNRNFRMAYCGTVTLHDETGRALHTIRYGRMPPAQDSSERYTHRGAHELMQRMRDDVVWLRARRPELPVVLLADGAAEMWNLLGAHLNERTLGVAPVERVDVRCPQRARRARGDRRSRAARRRRTTAGARRHPVPGQPRRAHGLRLGPSPGPGHRQRRGGGDLQEPGGHPDEARRVALEGADRQRGPDAPGLAAQPTAGRPASPARSSRSPRPSAWPRHHRVVAPSDRRVGAPSGHPGNRFSVHGKSRLNARSDRGKHGDSRAAPQLYPMIAHI